VVPRYDRGVIWEPFILALFLGLVVSAALYFAYLWPSVEPEDPGDEAPAEPIAEPSAAPVAERPAEPIAAEQAP
jgi:hypothetical protein